MTRGGPGPGVGGVGDAGKAEGHGPHSDPCERVELADAREVRCPKIEDAPIVHATGGDASRGGEISEPPRRVRIVVVVDDHRLVVVVDDHRLEVLDRMIV